MEIDVKGHSGCSVDVVREGKQLYIYKTSYDKNYLHRLRFQGEKQRHAQRMLLGNIKVPKILDVIVEDQKTQLIMEYVYSKNYVEYFNNAGSEQIESFIDNVIQFVEREISQSKLQEVPNKVLIDKFNDVRLKICKTFQQDIDVMRMLDMAESRFNSIGTIVIPVGVCHGDLTFSNILFNGNNLYLIDFLDSFIESPLLDIVKLRQDSAFLWSRLMYNQPVDDVRLKIISERIDSRLDNHFSNKYSWYSGFYDSFQLMNMLRILQYAKDTNVIIYLKRIIQGLL